ncbi:MAG: hypothetical protein MPJ50_12355 [Pirellulales bacterium]|nr:hypothetical protein [Pirellulales bacterium]
MKLRELLDQLGQLRGMLELGEIDGDEPVHLLRATDLTSPAALNAKADLLEKLTGSESGQAAETRRLAIAMYRYAGRKVPNR